MKKRILIVATSMSEIGGQSIQAQRLLDAFAEDESIEVGFLPNNPQTVFQNIKFFRTIFASIRFWWLLLRNVYKYDVIHIFSSAMTGYVIATLPPLFFAKLYGKKTILNYHSGEAEEHLRIWKRTAKPSMKLFDKIIVPSQFLVDVFSEFGLEAEAVFNFVDNEKFKFRRREKLRPIFLSNRNFEKHYDVSTVIKSFGEIQKRYPEARLRIAGSGSEENSLKDLVREMRLENVEFLGKIPNEEMPDLYDSADIYLNSSIVDNMPLSIIEAFSAGIPVVSTNAGGIPYIVKDGETGLLAELKDFQSIAQKSFELLENNEKSQMIAEKAFVETSKYTREKVKQDWTNCYRKLIT